MNGVSQPTGYYNSSTAPGYFAAGTGSLLVMASNPTNITSSVSGSSLSLSWPADHLGWILQSQTNWVDIPGTDAVTSKAITINPAVPTEFYRLRYP